ncbi:hypothetical protein [Novosphingobium meiothermophilum]|uniref:hypothetical protein n=1 Tax=Novosphingobium meiothermophilum TaxID=2202251 RepID=UPI000D6E96E1|nr:hypothetical protein [Novosphingobium meiothermophilum]
MFTKTPIIRGFDVIRPLYDLLGDRGVICGGYARYCASPTVSPIPADDVDVYCHTEEDFAFLKGRISGHLGVQVETNRAITFKTSTTGKLAFVPKIQLIKPVKKFRMVTVGSAEEVIGNFDFTVVRAAIVSPTEVLVDHRFAEDEEAKRLRLINIHCPISSTLRSIKYVERGYNLLPFDLLELFLDWDRRDEDYRVELVEGLNELKIAYGGGKLLPNDRLTALYDLINVD